MSNLQQKDTLYSSAGGQPQMKRDGNESQPPASNPQSQDTNFFNQAGEQVKTMAHGAADVASGATQATLNLARGAATGAANITAGAADALKNTFGTSNSPKPNPPSAASSNPSPPPSAASAADINKSSSNNPSTAT